MSALEKWVLAGMAAGVTAMLQPWWEGGLRVGFFATALFALLHVVVTHLPERRT